MPNSSKQPDWRALYEVAASQQGLFTTRQAADAGFSRPLLSHYVKAERIYRVRRRVYRLVFFPPGDHEELVAIWLWSEHVGVFSLQTALILHELSDALPLQVSLTVPPEWKKRRMRVPEGVALHYADVPSEERSWVGSVPVTTPVRTLEDCAQASLPPELLRQAATEAVERGLVAENELGSVADALRAFGGLEG